MNYKHLHYFWTVLRTGSIARASEELHLTPQTLSGQIKQLEQRLGKPLLRKVGRGLEPTDAGRMVQRGGKNPRRHTRCRPVRIARCSSRHPAAECGAGGLHLQRRADGTAPCALPHGQPSLPQ